MKSEAQVRERIKELEEFKAEAGKGDWVVNKSHDLAIRELRWVLERGKRDIPRKINNVGDEKGG